MLPLPLVLSILGVLIAEPAWAWGPVTHAWFGAQALTDLTGVAQSLQPLFTEHRWAFLYGCIAPDVIQAKRYAQSLYGHCHGWGVGWQIYDSATSPTERAFAYGYLAHLAADAYSHNFFVPGQLVASFPSRVRRHVYWEARFESHFAARDRTLLGQVLEHRSSDCDELVERVVARTLFSASTNRRIFKAVVALQQVNRWQEAFRRVTERSRFELPSRVVTRYRSLAVSATRDLLRRGEDAMVLRWDPTGHEKLREAKNARRRMRDLRRRGAPVEPLRREFLAALRREEDGG